MGCQKWICIHSLTLCRNHPLRPRLEPVNLQVPRYPRLDTVSVELALRPRLEPVSVGVALRPRLDTVSVGLALRPRLEPVSPWGVHCISQSRTPLIRENLTPCRTTTYKESGAPKGCLIFRKHFCNKHLHFTSPNTGSSCHENAYKNSPIIFVVKHNCLIHNLLQKIRVCFRVPDFSQQIMNQVFTFHPL